MDDIDIESEFRKDDVYHLSPEDRERQKREQEESRRVLQELKSVLGFKASEAERQKWKQLLFSDHGKLRPQSAGPLRDRSLFFLNHGCYLNCRTVAPPVSTVFSYRSKIILINKKMPSNRTTTMESSFFTSYCLVDFFQSGH